MSYLDDISAIWSVTRGDPKITIAILDGPVERRHASLAGANLTDLSLQPGRSRLSDAAAAHGTHVCSIIFGQGNGGVQGIAPNCRGIVISIFREGASPGTIVPCSQVELAAAIDRAVVAGANIINISGGQYSTYGTAHPILARVIQRAASQGILIVSATGNDACPCYHIPSAHPSVLAVGAHNANGVALESSNWGEKYRENGIVACGENILGAVPGGTRAWTGTSFATPIVSGVAALLMSCLLRQNRQPNGTLVQQAILQSAFRCFEPSEECQRLLAGRLNPVGALELLLEDSPAMTREDQPTAPATSTSNIPASAAVAPTVEPAAVEQVSPSAPPVAHESEMPVDSTSIANASNGSSAMQSTPSSFAPSQDTQSAVTPSDCGCGCAGEGPLVYALGEIGYDFGTEARRDSIQQLFTSSHEKDETFPSFLKRNPWAAPGLIWTLSVNNVPIYAIRPSGPYSENAYEKLVDFYMEHHEPPQEAKGKKGAGKQQQFSERAAIPGRITGQITLLNGHTVPVIQPEIRGMASWNVKELVDSVEKAVKTLAAEKKDKDADSQPPTSDEARNSLYAVLNKFYSYYQNLGITPQDRAINYVATNIFPLQEVVADCIGKKRLFDKIEIEPSEICRPYSECWVVNLYFFQPELYTKTERKKYRITVDVSDVVPVTIGEVYKWYVR